MSDDLISRSALREEIYQYVFPITTNNLMGAADSYYRIMHLLDDAPAVDAEPVRRGRWEGSNRFYICSLCGRLFDLGRPTNYCPNCGAKMKMEGEIE